MDASVGHLCSTQDTVKPRHATWITSLEIASCRSTISKSCFYCEGLSGRNFQCFVKSRAFSCEGGELYGDKVHGSSKQVHPDHYRFLSKHYEREQSGPT